MEVMTQGQPQRPTTAQTTRALLLGGLLPVAAFAVVEAWYGTLGGVIAGIAFGAGELIYEYARFGKIQGITIGANILVVVLGGVSLLEGDAVFFKLQPAILVFVFAFILIISSFMKRPFLLALALKQNPDQPEFVRKNLAAMNTRMGVCMFTIGLLSVHAAFFWSTAAWAFLKTVGAPLILFAYLAIEVILIRRRARKGQP